MLGVFRKLRFLIWRVGGFGLRVFVVDVSRILVAFGDCEFSCASVGLSVVFLFCVWYWFSAYVGLKSPILVFSVLCDFVVLCFVTAL